MKNETILFRQIIRYLRKEKMFKPMFTSLNHWDNETQKPDQKKIAKVHLKFYGDTFLLEETETTNMGEFIDKFTKRWKDNDKEMTEKIIEGIRNIGHPQLKSKIYHSIFTTVGFKLWKVTEKNTDEEH